MSEPTQSASSDRPLVWPKTYDEGTPEVTAKAFADDAPVAAKGGYRIGSQTWAGSALTVIYQRDAAPAAGDPVADSAPTEARTRASQLPWDRVSRPTVASAATTTPQTVSNPQLDSPPPRGALVERPVPRALTVGGIAILAGGAMAAIGTVLPWITAGNAFLSRSLNGWDLEEVHAELIASVGILTAVVGLLSIGYPRASTKVLDIALGWWVPALAGALGLLALGVIDISDVQRRIDGADTVIASVGIGLWGVLGGGVVTLVGALVIAGVTEQEARR